MRIGLCLSGGGIKGAAHIGVLKALEEADIKISMISGASSGSIVATLYAEGYRTDEIYKIFKEYAKKISYFEYKNIFKLICGVILKRKIVITGLSSGQKIGDYVKEFSKRKNVTNITDIKFPLFISSVNLENGDTYIFTSQDTKKDEKVKYTNKITISDAVRASCSYPGVFEPCEIYGNAFVDGGINENIPWKTLKKYGADKIISVVFTQSGIKECCNNLINVVDCSLNYVMEELREYEMIGNSEVINIYTQKINLLDSSKIDKLYEIGYLEAINYINKRL